MNWVKKSAVGLGLLVAMVCGTTCLLNRGIQKKIEIKHRQELVVDLTEENKKRIYNSAEEYFNDFFRGNGEEGYVDFMSKHSTEVRKNVELSGKEKVVEGYVEIHRKCLDLAVSRLYQEISDEDVDELSDRLVLHQKETAKEIYVDYEHPAVKQGYIAYGKVTAEFFKRVVKRNIDNPTGDFRQMIRNAYTREEFEEEIAQEEEARTKLYGGFAESLENYRGGLSLLVRLVGPGVARKTGEKSNKYNKEKISRIYGESK